MNKLDESALYLRLKNALNALEKERQRVRDLEKIVNEPVAVIGIACSLPGGIEDPQSLWHALINQYDLVTSLPDHRWSADAFVDAKPQQPGKMISDQGGFIRHHEKFDANFFGISPREAATMDPQQRLVLKNSWRALEDAGIAPDTLKGSDTGVFIGVTNTDYGHSLLKQSEVENVDGYSATGNALNVIAGRLSYFLDIQGPSVVMDTACSSSLVALHYACQSLRRKECHLAFCAGVNVIVLPEGNIALSQANMLSPNGRCYTFDERANGYVRSEGCVTLLLKLLSDAEKADDKIYAYIKGTAVNHGGKSSGLTVPNTKSQAALIKQALKSASLTESDVDYIEAHGTGTALGDPIEINALTEVFANSHNLDKPLLIGSIKTNCGHLESASGLLGLLKVILSMNHDLLPANIHFKKINPMINLDVIPAKVVAENMPWQGEKIAGVSSFGFSGINAHAVVASYHSKAGQQVHPHGQTHSIITCSAKDAAALRVQKEKLKTFLLNNSNLKLSTVSYNYNVCRNHFSYRQSFVAKSVEELLEKLNQDSSSQTNILPISNKRKRTAFLLSGQGSQYNGMGKLLYQTSPLFKSLIDQGCEKINKRLGYDLQDIMFAKNDERINQTIHTQPILFIFNYALSRLWMSWGVTADCYIGHSIGEYVAATLAEVMTLDDALFLVYERARLMQSLDSSGGMLLVMAQKEQLEPILKENGFSIDFGIITEDYTVLSGRKDDLDKLENMLKYPFKSLIVSHAFHSSLMDPILKQFHEITSQVIYKEPNKHVISNLNGELYGKETVNADYWVNHLRHAVDLRKSMATLTEQNFNVLLEIGPRPTFSKSSGQFEQILWTYSLRREAEDWHSLLMNLVKLYESGISVDWKSFYDGFPMEKISIPGYPFQDKDYWALEVKHKTDKKELLLDHLYAIESQHHELAHTKNVLSDEPMILMSDIPILIDLFKIHYSRLTTCNKMQNVQMILSQQSVKHIVFAFKSNSKMLDEIQHQYQLFLELVKSLLAENIKGVTIWLLSTTDTLMQSPLLGLRKCFLLETQDIDCVHIEIDSTHWNETIVNQVISEIQNRHDEKQIIYKQGKRYLPRLKRFEAKTNRTYKSVIDKNACYLITGGQGALAREVAQWYVKQGTSHLILLSRRNTMKDIEQLIETSAKQGCQIDHLTIDVSDKEALHSLFGQFGRTIPHLKGIIHAAGVLDDALIQNQTWSRFEGLFNAKILGSWYLHELSLAHQLDHFILFSSMASVLGTPGQSNYAAANAFLDRLAAYRQEQRLPALSINWGPWSDVGMAKNIITKAQGLMKLTPHLGIALFDTLMHCNHPSQVMAAHIDWDKASSHYGIKVPFLEHLLSRTNNYQKEQVLKSLDINALRELAPDDLKNILIEELQTQFRQILRLDTPLTLKQNFFELGMDSLMAIELRNNLQLLFGNTFNLSQTVLFELSTISDLTNYLVSVIHTPIVNAGMDSLLSHEEILLSSLDELSEDDIDSLLEKALKSE